MLRNITILILFLAHSLFAAPELKMFERFSKDDGGPDTRGAIWYDDGNIFVADHGKGLWKIDECGLSHGQTTDKDRGLWDIWPYQDNLFGIGNDGMYIYDKDGNYLNTFSSVRGDGIYVQNGYAYIVNESSGITIVNIKDINNPIVVDTIMTGKNFSQIRGTALKGDGKNSGYGKLLYVTTLDGELYVFKDDKQGNITYQNNIMLFSGEEARKLFISKEGLVYVDSNFGELAIVETDKNTFAMSIKDKWSSSESHGRGSQAPAAGGVFVTEIDSKTYALITAADGNKDGYLYWLDVTDPTNITHVDTLHDTQEDYGFNNIWLNDTKIYLAAHNGFTFMSMSGARNTPVISIKDSDDTYKEDITVTQNAASIGETKTFYAKITNEHATEKLNTRLKAPASDSKWEYKYYDVAKDKEITAQITTNEGYELGQLNSGESKEIKIEITPIADDASDTTVKITASNKNSKEVCGQALQSDDVSAKVTFKGTPPLSGTCEAVFPSPLNSTSANGGISMHDKNNISGTTNHELITQSLSLHHDNTCDGAPCVKSNTLADTLSFTVESGNSTDGSPSYGDNANISISSDKEYGSFNANKNATLTITGDVTIKIAGAFKLKDKWKLAIDGNVTIYADSVEFHNDGMFDITGSLKILVRNKFRMDHIKEAQNISSAEDLVILADEIDLHDANGFKALMYANKKVELHGKAELSGAITAANVSVDKDSQITYDAGAVNAYCGKVQPKPASNITLNAVNTGSPFLDGNLTTQIVNQPFTVTLGAYNETLGSVVADMNITNIDLIDPLGNLYAHLFSGSILTGADGTAVVSLNIPKAYKDTTLKISGSYMDRVYSGKSGDDFAIRPKRFSMQIPPQNIAGKNFTITLAARDANDAPASNYNETINHSFNLNFTEQKKSSCLTGTMDLGSIAFTDGNATHTTHYSETGMLDFNLSEIPGHEFAVIDADDTPDSQRLITAATATDINFTVDHFDISGLDLIDGSNHFTYYAAPADMQQMAARIVLTLTAKNALGTTTQNYSGGCYAKDVMLDVHFDTNTTPTQQNRLAWQEDGNSSHAQESALSFNGSIINGSFVYDIPKMRFVSGENNNSIKINFHRNYTVAKEPMRFTLTRLDAVNSDNRSGTITESHTGDFYYGRQHASDYIAVGNRLDAKIFHELYCGQCDRKGLFTLLKDSPESVDNVRWYRISDYSDGISGFSAVTGTYHTIPVTSPVTSSTTATQISSSTALGAETNGIDNITFTVPKEDLPFKDRIRYLPKPWLIYKKFPSADPRHTFDIDLSVVPKEWAGRGETGYTVDLNVSGRKSGMKLDW